MKLIGILFGQERTFPLALVDRINNSGVPDIVAEPVRLGGVSLETPKTYDLVLDRISQDIPFYRAVLKKFAADGTVVVNNPFWWSADDKFFNNVVARAVGVAVPKTVLLPSRAPARHDLGVHVKSDISPGLGRDLRARRLPRLLQAVLGRRVEERLSRREPRRVL